MIGASSIRATVKATWARRAALLAVAMVATLAALVPASTSEACILPFSLCGEGAARAEPAAKVTLPRRALLAPLPQPDCELRQEVKGDDAVRARLDYERQCYRHYEMIARQRLMQLQAAVAHTMRTMKQTEKQADKAEPWQPAAP